jgi:hypothetical protein
MRAQSERFTQPERLCLPANEERGMNRKLTEKFLLADGTEATVSRPVIVSASRATDVPAFFADWFANRLRAGYCAWVNPFNAHQRTAVSFDQTRAIVFWSKNPRPLFKHLPLVEQLGIGYYVQFTLNDYEADGLEPGVPPLEHRLETFRMLADRLGPERVVWRFDPLLTSPTLPIPELLRRIERLADRLRGLTRKLVFSFADIAAYRKVQSNLGKLGHAFRELTAEEMQEVASGLRDIAGRAGLELATCAEALDLSALGIAHNRCIDDDLLARLYPEDAQLMAHLGRGQDDLFAVAGTAKKDAGQRKECGCIVSKDIGAYNTCPHLCTYCYANSSRDSVLAKFKKHDRSGEFMTGSGEAEPPAQSPVFWQKQMARS